MHSKSNLIETANNESETQTQNSIIKALLNGRLSGESLVEEKNDERPQWKKKENPLWVGFKATNLKPTSQWLVRIGLQKVFEKYGSVEIEPPPKTNLLHLVVTSPSGKRYPTIIVSFDETTVNFFTPS